MVKIGEDPVMDYMPLYGNKTPSEYVSIHLNFAIQLLSNYFTSISENIRNTIYILSDWFSAYKYVEINASFGPQIWLKLLFVGMGNLQFEAPT